MWLDPRRYEVMETAMADVLRRKSGDEKLEILDGMWRMARDLIRDKLRHDFPQWTQVEIDRETARRLSRAATTRLD